MLSQKENQTGVCMRLKLQKWTMKKMRIHFKGYSHRYDEWKDYTDSGIVSTNFPIVKLEKLEKPSSETLGERTRILLSTLHLEIKRRLLSTRTDDPDVRLELPIDEDVFCEAFGSMTRFLLQFWCQVPCCQIIG